MRTSIKIVALATLALAAPAYAQSPSAQSPSAQSTSPRSPSDASSGAGAASAQRFKKVEIVDYKELPVEAQTQVDALTAKMQPADVQKLHVSLDAIPEASAALKEKGLSSSQIIVASLDNGGTLTLITRRT